MRGGLYAPPPVRLSWAKLLELRHRLSAHGVCYLAINGIANVFAGAHLNVREAIVRVDDAELVRLPWRAGKDRTRPRTKVQSNGRRVLGRDPRRP